jgi:glutamyl-tRNA reductase
VESSNWRLVVCGLTHKTSSLEQRESFQLGAEELPGASAVFSELSGVLESAILSTCNRVEFYFVASRRDDPFDVVSRFYRKFKGLDVASQRDLFDTKTGRDAADQLFRVAAGIDSMVIGESQILGQVKDAYSSACAVKSAGKVIHRLFHQAFRAGKRVRSETAIGKGACSVSSAVTEMLEDKLKAVGRPTVLFVGVNQMIRLAAKRLSRMNSCRFVFANRTLERARQLAAGFDAEGYGLDALTDLLTRADIVISCTSSDEPIIDQIIMTGVLDRRSSARLILVDMAIPRDIDVPKDWNPLVEVYDLEDIKRFVSDRQQQRQSAVPEAEEIICCRLDEFDYWYQHVLLEPVYNGRGNVLESLREEEIASILKKLPQELQKELNRATRRIVDRVVQVTKKADARQSE